MSSRKAIEVFNISVLSPDRINYLKKNKKTLTSKRSRAIFLMKKIFIINKEERKCQDLESGDIGTVDILRAGRCPVKRY